MKLEVGTHLPHENPHLTFIIQPSAIEPTQTPAFQQRHSLTSSVKLKWFPPKHFIFQTTKINKYITSTSIETSTAIGSRRENLGKKWKRKNKKIPAPIKKNRSFTIVETLISKKQKALIFQSTNWRECQKLTTIFCSLHPFNFPIQRKCMVID